MLTMVLKYGVPALVALFMTWAAIDRFDQAGKVRQLARQRDQCIEVAGSAILPEDGCPKPIAAIVRAKRRADLCDAALAEGDIYNVRATCSEQVKRAEQQRTSAIAERDNARDQLAGAVQRTDQAVQRAETRATAAATRKTDNARTIQLAPRNPDGSVRCDADCLRRLGGEAAVASPGS